MRGLALHTPRQRLSIGLTLLLAVVLLLLAATPAFAVSRTVRVGLYENEPKVFTDPTTGKPAGIFVDILKEIAEDEGWSLVWVPGTWDEDLKALEEGRIDLMPDVAYSTERDEIFDFHKTPVVESWSHIYSAPGVRVDRFAQLNGRRVAVLKNSIQEKELARMAQGFGYDIELVPVATLKDAFNMAGEGKVDAAVANHLFGDYFYAQYRLTKTPIVFNAVPLYFATANDKNADLRAAIDRHLDQWIAQPGSVYYQILDRYTRGVAATRVPEWVLWVIGISVGLIVLVGAYAVLLRWQVGAQTRSLVEANDAVAKAGERYRLAVDAADEGIFDWYPLTGEVIWTYRNWQLLGFEPGEFQSSFETWSSRIHPDDRDRVLNEELRAISVGDRDFEIEYRLLKKDGSWMWTLSRGRAVEVNDAGEAVRVVGINKDITERHLAEQEIRQLNAELEKRVEERTAKLAAANEDLKSFSYSVSHDLRAPLRAISGFAQIVARRHRDDLNEEGRHYVDNIVQASERMGHLIEDLLTYSRLGRQCVNFEPVALTQVLEPIASDLESRLEEIGGTLEIAEDLPTIEGDRTLLTQIFTNLLENAVTYRRQDVEAKVTVGWRDEDLDAVVFVSDNGIGIPADYQDKVFNIFQRLHNEDEYPGTGIGLANVKKCVEMLGGEVWLESVEGEGTTFFVRLAKER